MRFVAAEGGFLVPFPFPLPFLVAMTLSRGMRPQHFSKNATQPTSLLLHDFET